MSDLNTYIKTVNNYVTSRSGWKTYAKEACKLALNHFDDTGDVEYFQRFYNASKDDEKAERHEAFVAWMQKHAPIAVDENGKLSKDKEATVWPNDHVKDLLIADGNKNPFYRLLKEAPEAKEFTAEEVTAAVKRILKRYQNPDKFGAKDDADERVTTLLAAIEDKSAPLPVVANDDNAMAGTMAS
jgi:hypothetical protein